MMLTQKCFGFLILLQTITSIELAPFHNDVPDLRDVMRKEEIENELHEDETFEHHNPVAPQNGIIQQWNQIGQPQSLHTFKKEYPVQQAIEQDYSTLPVVRPARNKLELIIQPEESELRRSEKANEGFEKILQFITILSQVDQYLTEKTQSTIKTIAKIAEETSNNQRKQY